MQVSWEARVGAMVRLGCTVLQTAQEFLDRQPAGEGGDEYSPPVATLDRCPGQPHSKAIVNREERGYIILSVPI